MVDGVFITVNRYFLEEVGMDDQGWNKGAGKSGRKTAMDCALDAGLHDQETIAKKFKVLAYLAEKGTCVCWCVLVSWCVSHPSPPLVLTCNCRDKPKNS